MKVENIVRTIHEYEIAPLGIRFVDRDSEVCKMLQLLESTEVKAWIYMITGPWGCGKSELLRALTYAMNRVSEDCQIVYFDLTEKEISRFYATTDVNIMLEVEKVLEGLMGERAKIPWHVYRIIKTLYERRKMKGEKIILIFDEVTYSLKNLREIEALITSLSDHLASLVKDLNCIAKALVVTSEQSASEVFTKISGKYLTSCLMWNLNKESFFELMNRLECPLDQELLWSIIGGNPRLLVELKERNWDLKEILKGLIAKVRKTIRRTATGRGEALSAILMDLKKGIDKVEDLDLTLAWNVLLEDNIVMHTGAMFLNLSEMPKERWTSNWCSFQIPAYYWILRTMIELKTDKVEVEDVMKRIRC